jgi:poly-gamma-glutamate synthesis protein (capsule biosynthesis protein)
MDRHRKKRRGRLVSAAALIIISAGLLIGYGAVKARSAPASAVAEKPASEATVSTASPEKAAVKSEVTVSSVGDCTIGYDSDLGYTGSFPYVFEKNNKDYAYFFKNTAEIFRNDDITAANLETTFTDATVKAQKTYNFKAPADQTQILKEGGIDAVNISNNHIYDYLDEGYEDTKAALSDAGIGFFGEGSRYIKEVDGVKFGFLGYSAFYSGESFMNKLKADIASLKAEGCIVIVNFHWGIEKAYTPNETQKNVAHYAIDNGADMVIGHHPHVVQSIETYKNKIICYSLGNFCFGGNKNPSDKDTFIAQAVFETEDSVLKSIGFRVIPASISSKDSYNDYCPTLLEGSEKNNFLAKLNGLSPNAGFEISDQFHYLEHESKQ